MKKKSQTLTEILTVISIIALIASIIAIGYFKRKKDNDKKMCKINLKAIKHIIEIYKNEHINALKFPKGLGIFPEKYKKTLSKYFQGDIFPECPSGGKYGIDDDGFLYCTYHKGERIALYSDIKTEKNNNKNNNIKKNEPFIPKLTEDEDYFQKGKELLYTKKYKEAAFFFEKAHSIKNKSFYLYYAALSYYKANEYNKAMNKLEPILSYKKAQDLAKLIHKKRYFNALLESKNIKLYTLFYLFQDYTVNNIIYRSDPLVNEEHICEGQLITPDFCVNKKNKMLYYVSGDKLYSYDIKKNESTLIFKNKGLLIYGLDTKKNNILFLSPSLQKNLQLVLFNTKKSIAISITDEKKLVKKAKFSPDGFHIYYLANDIIYRYNIETFKEHPIVKIEHNLKPINFDVHPYKNELVVVMKNLKEEQTDLYIWKIDKGLQSIIITRDRNEYYPQYSYNGKIIAYITNIPKNGEELFIYNCDNKLSKKITSFKNKYNTFMPSFAFFPDNELIYFSYGENNNHSLYIVEVSSKKHLKITNKANDITKIFLYYKTKKENFKNKELQLFKH